MGEPLTGAPVRIILDTDLAMGDVPALGQHTLTLLLESGLDATAANDALSRGTAHQDNSVLTSTEGTSSC